VLAGPPGLLTAPHGASVRAPYRLHGQPSPRTARPCSEAEAGVLPAGDRRSDGDVNLVWSDQAAWRTAADVATYLPEVNVAHSCALQLATLDVVGDELA
jgi:hypothetical protein